MARSRSLSGSYLPSGIIMPFAGATTPAGWLLCDGSAISRTTYSSLFTALGTTHGAGDGSTTFNLPDLRGRTIAGKDDMGGAQQDFNNSVAGVAAGGATVAGPTSFRGWTGFAWRIQ